MSAEGDGVAFLPDAGVAATLGEYALITKLASGGMATVYVARKAGVAGFERLFAIKCCHPHLRRNEEFVAMFLDEARLAARIHHPNVVATLDVNDGDTLYLVMEYIEGFSLAKVMREATRNETPLPLSVVLRVMSDALAGLHAAHELRDANGRHLGLVHRDVSPQNILIGIDGGSRITDFGVAFAAARATATHGGRIKGKYSYLAPEQIKNLPATRTIDVFAAGIVLWEALTGRALFRGDNDVATINAVIGGEIPRPSSIVPTIPAALDAVVLRALQRDPSARYPTAAEFADAIERVPVSRATIRTVAAHIEKVFGAALAERREIIRTAAAAPSPAHVRDLLTPALSSERGGASSRSGTRSFRDAGDGNVVEFTVPISVEPPPLSSTPSALSAEEIEHRRIRGAIAALMLLLVGGALGLLLARSGPSAKSDPGATSGERSIPSSPPSSQPSQPNSDDAREVTPR